MSNSRDFKSKALSLLNALKYEYAKRADELKIPIYDMDKVVAYLRPISADLGDLEPEYIRLMTKWRDENKYSYPTVFNVTEEGTRKYYENQLIKREDRILFMIVDFNDKPIGHFGLNNIDFEKEEAELDNLLRGVRGVMPGIMTMSFQALVDWCFNNLGVKRLISRPFSDNPRSLKINRGCGLRDVKEIPLHKFETEDGYNMKEIPADSDLSVDKKFALLELYKDDYQKNKKKMILTAGPSITQKEVDYVVDAVKNGWNENWSNYLDKLEQVAKNYLEVKFVLPTSSATKAMFLALKALGIGKGDEVIISDFSFVSASYAIVYTGAEPIFVDAEKESWGINPESIKQAITSHTKAILPVHMYASTCDMDKIMKIANEHNLKVMEDAAPALGSFYQGKKLGSIGDAGAFSFQGAKIAVCGEGGMLVTNNEDIYEKAAYYNNYCRAKGQVFWFDDIGYKFKMSNIQAALACAQVERIEELVAAKRKIYSWYQERLHDVEGLNMNYERAGDRSGYWMTSIVLAKDFGISRDEVMKKLKEKKIDTRPFFPPSSEYPMFKNVDTPVAHYLGENGINLPSGVLLTENEIEYICDCLREILKV